MDTKYKILNTIAIGLLVLAVIFLIIPLFVNCNIMTMISALMGIVSSILLKWSSSIYSKINEKKTDKRMDKKISEIRGVADKI